MFPAQIKSGQEAGVRTAPARMDFGKIERFGLRKVRFIVLLLGGLNGALIAAAMAVAAVSKRSGCPQPIAAAAGLVVTGAIARTIWMWVIGFVQVTTASTMLAEEVEPDLTHVTVLTRSIPSRHKRRVCRLKFAHGILDLEGLRFVEKFRVEVPCSLGCAIGRHSFEEGLMQLHRVMSESLLWSIFSRLGIVAGYGGPG